MTPIDKDIPFPTATKESKYPWVEMKIGDSFLMVTSRKSAYTMASIASKRYNKKFITATVDGGVLVWRIA